MAIPETQQPAGMDQLIAELLQLVGEILLIRRPRVHTASAPPPPTLPPPTPTRPHVAAGRCPFCPGGARGKRNFRLAY